LTEIHGRKSITDSVNTSMVLVILDRVQKSHTAWYWVSRPIVDLVLEGVCEQIEYQLCDQKDVLCRAT
jgi:hypothetical protein